MVRDKLQLQRWELKYIISERTAEAMRDFAKQYLVVDEFGVSRPNFAYPVHSLYLDSRDLRLYWDTINSNKNRFKLRLRYYDNQPDSPVFFEIKRRMNNCILKQRGGVRRDAVPWLLHGQLPQPEHLLYREPKYFVALQRFCQHMSHLIATPKVHISYLREAWVSPEDGTTWARTDSDSGWVNANGTIRVTFDREVRAAADFEARLSTEHEGKVTGFGDNVILELKFTERYPHWFRDMVRCFNLFQGSAAKYCEGVELIGEPVLREAPIMPLEMTGAVTDEGSEVVQDMVAEKKPMMEV
jgi:hypothetical protein